MKKILVNVMPEEIRMVVTNEVGLMEDLMIERKDEETIVNHIYRGTVRNVLPGMEAAFVDIGRGQNAYLNLKQGKQTKAMGKLFVGQNLMVQVVKEEMLGKSARVTADISLAGHFMVLLPYSEGLRISKKITDPKVRTHLKEMAESYMNQGGSFIIRTAAAEASAEEVRSDMKYLWQTWEQLQKRFKLAKNGSELYRDADFWQRLLRDYVSDEVDEIIVDDDTALETLQERLLINQGNRNIKLTLHRDKTALFKTSKVEEQLDLLVNKDIDLPSGGFLRIDFTEAMTVIDVNSGHFTGRTGDAGEMALEVNKEAAVEICRQLRLRDIGGIIICDFIDMPKKEQQAELLALLSQQAHQDRVKTVVCGITSLGLVEMTRKRERQSLQSVLFDTCDHCGGTGYLQSANTVVLQIKRKLRDLKRAGRLNTDLLIEVHPEVAGLFTSGEIKRLSSELHHQIKIEENIELNREAYSLMVLDS